MINSPPPGSSADDTGDTPIRRRSVLAVGGAVVVAGLSGCLSRVASAVTNTGASPAAVFSGTQGASAGDFVVGEPHVSRLTPTLAERVELEGWVTSSPVMAQNHNSSRSNRTRGVTRGDADSDADGVEDADEDNELIAYLSGEAMVAERFTVCLPDAEVPGGNGSIEEAVTPERLLSYLTGETTGEGRVYSWGTPKADSDGGGDCDDDDSRIYPAVCGTTPHLVADVTGPMSTGGGIDALRVSDGTLLVSNAPTTERGASVLVCPAEGEAFEPADLRSWGARADGVPPILTQQGRLNGLTVAQVTVQPPGCPHPFPALFYVSRGESNGQLIYSGGWVIDDASLYEDSATVLTVGAVTPVFGIDLDDLDSDGDGFGDVVEQAVRRTRARIRYNARGAQPDTGPLDELVETDVLSPAVAEGVDSVVRKRPGGRSADGGGGGGRIAVTHLAVDAPVLHLVDEEASNEVKFKAGAELSG